MLVSPLFDPEKTILVLQWYGHKVTNVMLGSDDIASSHRQYSLFATFLRSGA
jgi:hypothetical protein